MGNQVSTALRWTHTASIIEQPPLPLTRGVERITRSCSYEDYPVSSTRQPHAIPKSYPINHSHHSLVNMAPELCNRIYAYLLVVEDNVVLAPFDYATVPGLVILRTCKQIHNEAASLFYAANSFQCYVYKGIPTQTASEEIQYPNLSSLITPTTFFSPLSIPGGILFPAPRYHQYFTRLTIGLQVSIRRVDMVAGRPCFRSPTSGRCTKEYSSLWGERDGRWSGSVIMPTQPTAQGELMYWLEFHVDAKEEAITRRTPRDETQQDGRPVFDRTQTNKTKGLFRLISLHLPHNGEE